MSTLPTTFDVSRATPAALRDHVISQMATMSRDALVATALAADAAAAVDCARRGRASLATEPDLGAGAAEQGDAA